jgi:hypothetical protein
MGDLTNRDTLGGLTPDELEAEVAVELPDREAMSIVGLPAAPLPVPALPVIDAGPDAVEVDPDV